MSFERFETGPLEWEAQDAPAQVSDPSAEAAIAIKVRSEVDQLDQWSRPNTISEQKWFALLRDARGFTERWLDLALGCGWPLHDLYGFNVGVVFLLDGRDALSLDDNRIIIGNPNSTTLTFYRHSPGVSVPFDRSRAPLVWDALRLQKSGVTAW